MLPVKYRVIAIRRMVIMNLYRAVLATDLRTVSICVGSFELVWVQSGYWKGPKWFGGLLGG